MAVERESHRGADTGPVPAGANEARGGGLTRESVPGRDPPYAMINKLKAGWRQLLEGEPGSRFKERYHRAHQRRQESGGAAIARMAAGIALIALGVVMLVAPGPGLLAIAAGGAILASDFLVVARFLDTAELWGRRSIERVRQSLKR